MLKNKVDVLIYFMVSTYKKMVSLFSEWLKKNSVFVPSYVTCFVQTHGQFLNQPGCKKYCPIHLFLANQIYIKSLIVSFFDKKCY